MALFDHFDDLFPSVQLEREALRGDELEDQASPERVEFEENTGIREGEFFVDALEVETDGVDGVSGEAFQRVFIEGC